MNDGDWMKIVLSSIILFYFFAYPFSSLWGKENVSTGRGVSAGQEMGLTGQILFLQADADGDGRQETWDVLNSTYSDPHKPLVTANRLIRTLTIGTTLVLFIDIYQRSAVPALQDFDGFPDMFWQPFTGIVNSPVAQDFDGDGLTDLGIDMNNDGQIDGALSLGRFREFGTLSVSIKDSENGSIQDAKVFIESNYFSELQKTDQQGRAQFSLVQKIGNTANLKIECDGFAPLTKTVSIDPWSANSIDVSLAKLDGNSGFNARNYPNPVLAGDTMHLSYSITSESQVKFDLYDINFRFVRRLLEENKLPGQYLISFEAKDSDGNSLEKGLYYGILRSGQEKEVVAIVVR